MSTDNHVNESILNSDIKEWQKKNRIDHMAYLPGMEVLESEVQAQVIESMNAYDYTGYTKRTYAGRWSMTIVRRRILRRFCPLRRCRFWRRWRSVPESRPESILAMASICSRPSI